jgi:ribonuclease PH
VHVHVVLLSCGGGELSASVCGAALALADAGVPLHGLVAGCTAVQPATASDANSRDDKGDDECVLNPPVTHGAGVAGAVSLAVLFVGRALVPPRSGILTAEDVAAEAAEAKAAAEDGAWAEAVAQFSQAGQLSGPQLRAAFASARSGCKQMHAAMAAALARAAEAESALS